MLKVCPPETQLCLLRTGSWRTYLECWPNRTRRLVYRHLSAWGKAWKQEEFPTRWETRHQETQNIHKLFGRWALRTLKCILPFFLCLRQKLVFCYDSSITSVWTPLFPIYPVVMVDSLLLLSPCITYLVPNILSHSQSIFFFWTLKLFYSRRQMPCLFHSKNMQVFWTLQPFLKLLPTHKILLFSVLPTVDSQLF